MMQPKRTTYRKTQKGRNRGTVTSDVAFGTYGMKCVGRGELTARQIEAARRVISRITKRGGKLYIRTFPDVPRTKKPLEVRMGKGKGSVEYWVAKMQPGRMVFELDGVDEELARDAFRKAAAKLGVPMIFVKRTVL
ncbi:MAG: 50S ribosomal protein L16 [Pseudomonadota bacterium]|nr:50S ribosomal protein L16 [Pseudomonadota bacterium]